MKLIKKCISFVIALAITLSCMVIPTQAVEICGSAFDGYKCHSNFHTFGDKVMNYGVGEYGARRRYYWLSGFSTYYADLARDAASEWVNTTSGVGVTTSISMRETTTQSQAVFEIVRDSGNELKDGVLGLTVHYLYQNKVLPDDDGGLVSNYGWAQCIISTTHLTNYVSDEEQRQATIAHELGHAMGLSHQNCRASSIMCQLGKGRIATRADATDCRTINHLYG